MAKQKDPADSPRLPINYHELLAKQVAEVQKKVAAPSGDRIKMNGNSSFTLPNGQDGAEIEVVIVDFVSSNLFYDRAFDANNPSPPACFAVGDEPSLLIPVADSPDKQSETCATCPNNQFGSAGRGKACKNTRLLAVTPVAEEDDDSELPIWILSVPPTSIKAIDGYVHKLAMKQKITPIGVVTRISLDRSTTFSAPRFEDVRPLRDDELARVFPMIEEAKDRLRAVPDFTQYQAPAPSRGGSALGARRGGR
jgi:hypothetical protein